MPTDSPFGRLTRSAIAFPWAISWLGVQQIVNLVAAPARGRMAAATGAFDALTRATHERPGDWREQTWRAAKTLRRAAMDLAKVRPPSIDSSSLMRLAADSRLAPVVSATAGYVVPPLAWLDSFRIASGDAPALLREAANKLRIIQVAADAPSRLGLDKARDEPLERAVERVAGLKPFSRFWTLEALGAWYGDRALARANGGDPEPLLGDEATAGVPSWSLTMLHAGIGASFAGQVIARLAPASSPAVAGKAIARFVRLCRRASRSGYAGAALESLGFVARAFHESLVSLLDREIPRVEPGLLGYFWHGVGRAMYFAPGNLLPSANAPRSMIADLEREAPHEFARRNALSGIAWATTLANLQDPEVMEVFLRYHGALAADATAFVNGVSSAVAVRSLTTPDDACVRPFIDHEPRSGAAGAAAWRSLVAIPCRAALDRRAREVQQADAFEELFHYRPGPA